MVPDSTGGKRTRAAELWSQQVDAEASTERLVRFDWWGGAPVAAGAVRKKKKWGQRGKVKRDGPRAYL